MTKMIAYIIPNPIPPFILSTRSFIFCLRGVECCEEIAHASTLNIKKNSIIPSIFDMVNVVVKSYQEYCRLANK